MVAHRKTELFKVVPMFSCLGDHYFQNMIVILSRARLTERPVPFWCLGSRSGLSMWVEAVAQEGLRPPSTTCTKTTIVERDQAQESVHSGQRAERTLVAVPTRPRQRRMPFQILQSTGFASRQEFNHWPNVLTESRWRAREVVTWMWL